MVCTLRKTVWCFFKKLNTYLGLRKLTTGYVLRKERGNLRPYKNLYMKKKKGKKNCTSVLITLFVVAKIEENQNTLQQVKR